MEKLQTYFTELSTLFGYKYDDSFFDYLKSISVPNSTICGKEIKLGDGGWKCKDCELDTYSIYCNDCFIKEKHLGHKILFHPAASGFCDCGVSLTLKPEGFCDKHKGDYDNINDLMNFIKSSINEKLLNNINDIFNKIISLFIDKIKDLVDKKEKEENKEEKKEEEKKEEEKKEEKEEDEIYKMFDELEIFTDKLFKANLSLFYYFVLKFTENYPYETRHKCFSYDENKNLVTFIPKSKEEKHKCICPFMQVMIYILMKINTNQNTSSFFNLFFQTYKNKIITSLCFLNTFSELFYDKNLILFREMGYQLVNENLSVLVYQSQNIPFLENCFEEMLSVCDYFLKQKEYGKLMDITYRIYEIISYLPSRTTIDKINHNTKIIDIIIDICCVINNANFFENKIKFDEFQGDRYRSDLIEIEIFCLMTIICLIHIINFDNEEIIKTVFNKIFGKLFEFKTFKESLADKIFSPHLITFKCYSLFLNRYCFNYSMKHNCDLFDSFQHFLDIFPKAKELNEFIFNELINFFGFMISNLYLFFAYFGRGMYLYYINYFNIIFIIIKCDIALMKYLLTLPEIKSKFTISNILSLSEIDSSNTFLQSLLKGELNLNNIDTINTNEERNLKYNNSLLEFLY